MQNTDTKMSLAARLHMKKFVTVGFKNPEPIAMQTVPFPTIESMKNAI